MNVESITEPGVDYKTEYLYYRHLKNSRIGTNGKYLYLQIFKTKSPCVRICAYHRPSRCFQVLYTSSEKQNIIQASVNSNSSLLAFVTKDLQNSTYNENEKNRSQISNSFKNVYKLSVVNIGKNCPIFDLNISSEKQIMTQFLYRKKSTNLDRLLVLIHQQSIALYELRSLSESKVEIKLLETVVSSFSWAQWDVPHQCLFYIHNRRSLKQEDDKPAEHIVVPTLSAFQFHDDMPHETVLNIPVNIPAVKKANISDSAINIYDDVPVPLRVHDCSLNILVLMQPSGIVYICHYYFYQPVTESVCLKPVSASSSQCVHFAYSITALHHGSITHCSVANINWSKAIDVKPIFCMYGEQHLIVQVSDLFTHILDLGIDHEPCCHFTISSPVTSIPVSYFVPLPGTISEMLDLSTLNIYKISVSKKQLMGSFNDDESSIHNKLSILHYILVHLNDLEMISEILLTLEEKVTDINNVKLMKEILVGGCYASMSRHLSSDVVDLLRLLPLTTTYLGTLPDEKGEKIKIDFVAFFDGKLNDSSKDSSPINQPSKFHEMMVFKINSYSLTLEQEMLYSPSVMLLTPRQRLIPFRNDVWTRLWNLLPDHILTHPQTSRFRNSVVVDKLAVSLVCYQPEALSRCCTPLSPGAPLMASTGMLADIANISRFTKAGIDPLPFNEIEASAASRQEHIISVNLREVSLHLVKLGKNPMQVHAVAMRYASSQLEMSRILCSYLTQAAGIDTKKIERGFFLIDRIPEELRRVLFALMERYYVAVDTLAFPFPQGFTSFFAYLGYRVFPTSKFIDYVRANVFQVNIDVMKAIMRDLPDKGEALKNKLNLLLQLPRSRVRRILNQWAHPVSLMIRAREHSMNILSGISGLPARNSALPKGIRHGAGLTAFPSNERLSPLDTFLDLLTAKASLTEIDFSLLIDATITSTEDFLEK